MPLPPLTSDQYATLAKQIETLVSDRVRQKEIVERLLRASEAAMMQPELTSCLRDAKTSPVISCKKHWGEVEIEAFRNVLHPSLVTLVCEEDVWPRYFDQYFGNIHLSHSTFGLAQKLVAQLPPSECIGLQSLTKSEKAKLKKSAKREAFIAEQINQFGVK